MPCRFPERLLQTLVPPGSVDAARVEKLKATATGRTLVYVLPNASRFDYLLMKSLAHQFRLPVPSAANDLPVFRFSRHPAYRHRRDCRKITGAIEAGRSAVLFLGKSGWSAKPFRWNVLIWEDLIRTQRRDRARILLAPVSVLWGRRPDRIRRSLADVFFGDTSAPGILRKLFITAVKSRDIRIKFGEAVELDRFLSETSSPNDETYAKKLRRLLSVHLYRERKLVTGPPRRDRKRVIRQLLKDPEIRDLVASVSRREKKPEARTWKRAKSILKEMIADFDPAYLALGYRAYRWLWSRLYPDTWVDEAGLERVRNVIQDYPTILVPSHKSHVDYLLLSGIFYERDMMPPLICAGVNLSFWPMGNFFRKTGAFFIRRRITGDLLYARLLFLYVRWLVKTGYTQEFFIEGGRTRTGKLIYPKHGLLALQVDSFLSGASKDLYVVPVATSYEKVPEEASYRAELTGEAKPRENFVAVLKSRKFLKRPHGGAYVRFGKPISAREYFGTDSDREISTRDRKAKTFELAKEIVRTIASETVITASSLGATALLTQREPDVPEAVLDMRLRRFRSYALQRGFPVSPKIAREEIRTAEIVEFFVRHEWVDEPRGTPPNRSLRVDPEKRLNLDFYKNMILHYFLPPAVVAAARESAPDEAARRSAVEFLYGLFTHEFLLRPDAPLDAFIEGGASELAQAPSENHTYAGLIANYLEAYDWAAGAVKDLNLSKLPLRDPHMREILKYGRQLLETGILTRPEAVTTANVKSAYAFFNEKGFLLDHAALEAWHARLKPLIRR